MVTVTVNRKAADRVASGHPWIFSSDVVDRGDAAPGDAVRVRRSSRQAARGRALQFDLADHAADALERFEPIDRTFFLRRLRAAILHRERVVQNSNACRLVFSEGDLLPGLIVDRYGAYLVMQTLSQGMDRARDRDRRIV